MKKLFKMDPMFKDIFNIGILYANPSYVDKMRKKPKYNAYPEEIYKDILIKINLLGTLGMLLIYFLFFAPVNFKKYPYMFDIFVGIFILINLFQTFTYFYNVFYESKDLESYMSLPIEESTVFKAKIAAVSVSLLQLLAPIIPAALFFGIKFKYNILIAIVFSILDFAVIGFLLVIVNCILMNILVKSAIISKFKNKIITGITVLTSFISVGMILLIQYFNNSNIGIENLYGPLSYVAKSYLGHLSLLVVTSIVLFLIYKFLISSYANHFYDYIRLVNENVSNVDKSKRRKEKKNKKSTIYVNNNVENVDEISEKSTCDANKYKDVESIGFVRSMIKYNLSIVSDSTIISQTLVSILYPLMIMFPSVMNLSRNINFIKGNEISIAVVIAIILSSLGNVYSMCLPAVIYSADGENFEYIKSLPISEKKYFIIKCIFSTALNTVLEILILIGVSIYFKLGIVSVAIGLVLNLLLNFGLGSQWVMYDYNHIFIDWQSTSEIYNRSNKLFSFTVSFIVMIISMIYMFGMMAVIENHGGSSAILFSIIICSIVITFTYIKTFYFLRNIE